MFELLTDCNAVYGLSLVSGYSLSDNETHTSQSAIRAAFVLVWPASIKPSAHIVIVCSLGHCPNSIFLLKSSTNLSTVSLSCSGL